ncbi:unnamed protein product [Zymoseptoria tritici ST99CH_1E4]|uniref:Uncharacterized protein n=1 Tax=Zymoseptoria tritici ST99CH_1E4 TaxID=1276532 RepID=A0A2H1GXQ6_ZYMTR|nr:unnamed protein product [Zymoseptoria tritici ST99CH_1E4]
MLTSGITSKMSSLALVTTSPLQSSAPPPIKMPTVLLDLPQELLDQIAGIIAIHPSSAASRKSLHDLSITCKKLLAASRPALYSSVHLDRPDGGALTNTRRLARTLYAAPHFGLLIRHITSDPASEPWDECRQRRARIWTQRGANNAELLQFEELFEARVSDQTDLETMKSTIAMGYGYGFRPDFLVVLLMASHARSVEVQTDGLYWIKQAGPGNPLDIFWSARNLERLPSGAFAHLEEVSISGLHSGLLKGSDPLSIQLRQTGDVEALSSVMRLPGIRRLRATGFGVFSDYSRWILAKRSSTVQSLTLLRSDLKLRSLTTLIETCAALKEFRYGIQWRDSDILENRQCPNYVLALRPALYQHRDSLQTLSITNFADRGCIWGPQYLEFSMSGFNKLVTLEVDMRLLVGNKLQTNFSDCVRDLPLSLRQLTVHTYLYGSALKVFTDQLSTLESLGLDEFKVTFPDHYIRPSTGYFKQGYRAVSHDLKIGSSDRRRFCIGHEKFPAARNVMINCWRTTFECQELQRWTLAEFDGLAKAIGERDILSLVNVHHPETWLSRSTVNHVQQALAGVFEKLEMQSQEAEG